ncbi:uncharacterized protein VTP21DRAFT_6278 [Calcarisporiella thermophila]|uniref:uncharacterized protein n=1 Tax=Calcarisporiella thermophila TaxID=911321 RepID=UPI00374280B0
MNFFKYFFFIWCLVAAIHAVPVESPVSAQAAGDRYVVVMKQGISRAAADLPVFKDKGVKKVTIGDFQAVTGKFDPESLKTVKSNPMVQFVEKDVVYSASWVQKNAPWGLARITQREKLAAGAERQYFYDPKGGEGITAYVMDSGVNIHHQEFEGRASVGVTYFDYDLDDLGHGTHVAGIIGGKTYGVAKKVKIVSVKVLDKNGNGYLSTILAGIEWVNRNARKGRSVVNMSLGGPRSDALNQAVEAAIANNTIIVAAAGNSNVDTCGFSPASGKGVISVAATDINDRRASYSNFGSQCTSLFAPGSQITSAYIGSNTAVRDASGTSMASPHVAGGVAVILAREGLLTPYGALQSLRKKATRNAIADAKGTPNLLLYVKNPLADILPINRTPVHGA